MSAKPRNHRARCWLHHCRSALEAALETALGGKSVTFTGVDYLTSIDGFLEGGDPAGSAIMAEDLTNAANSCPNAVIVSSGYSQGCQLVHNSAKQLTSKGAGRIKAVVIFGDPDNGQSVQGIPSVNVDVIYHFDDNICLGGDLVLPPHFFVLCRSVE
ncbi:cutinase [Mycena epipterygia]|nr:cutinase [Mycena epipterygia]